MLLKKKAQPIKPIKRPLAFRPPFTPHVNKIEHDPIPNPNQNTNKPAQSILSEKPAAKIKIKDIDKINADVDKALLHDTTRDIPQNTTIGKIKIESHHVNKLNPAKYNPRKISDSAKNGLSSSINRFGYVSSIVWNKTTGNVVGGHQRLNDLISKGATFVDVSVVELDQLEEKALNLVLNNPNAQGTFTEDLQLILEDIDVYIKEDLKLLSLEEVHKNINSEVDVDSIADEYKIVLKYSERNYVYIMQELKKQKRTAEEVLASVFGLEL